MFFFLFQPSTWLIAAAVIPALVLMFMIYRADRLDKESGRLLLRLVLCGCAAAGLSMLTESIGTAVLNRVTAEGSRLNNVLTYFLIVAGSEEGFKYLLMKKTTWNSQEFNCQFDGVVYAVFVALGFALLENVGYVISYGFGTALVRAVTAIPGHACFGVFMGNWYGLAKRYEHMGLTGRSGYCRKLALLVPILLHGAYDYIAVTSESDFGVVYFGIFVVLLFVIAFIMTRRLSRNDHFI